MPDRVRCVADEDGLPSVNIAIARSKYSRTEGHRVSVCQGFSWLSTAADEDARECDISGLLEMLGKVPDPRSARGRIYELSFILAVSLVAVLAGASSFR